MGKVIEFKSIKKKAATAKPIKQLPGSDNHKPVQQEELDYIDALHPLAEQATQLANRYGLSSKDVLTDALCLLIEGAIMEAINESQNKTPDPAI